MTYLSIFYGRKRQEQAAAAALQAAEPDSEPAPGLARRGLQGQLQAAPEARRVAQQAGGEIRPQQHGHRGQGRQPVRAYSEYVRDVCV